MLACLGTLVQLGYSVSFHVKSGVVIFLTPFQREMPVFGIVQDYPIVGIIVCTSSIIPDMTTYFRPGRNFAQIDTSSRGRAKSLEQACTNLGTGDAS